MKWIVAIILLFAATAFANYQTIVTASGTADDADYGYNVGLETCTKRDTDSLKVGTTTGSVGWGWECVFDDVQVPPNATVSAVTLRVQTKVAMVAGATEGLHAYIGVVQADNQTTVNASCYDAPSSWSYDNASWGANENLDITMDPSEFTTLFSRSGWKFGNSLTISMWEAGGSDRIMWLKSIASFAHTLTITYTCATCITRMKVEADSGDGRGLGTDYSRTGEMYHGYLNGNGLAQSYHWMKSLIPAGRTIAACSLVVRANGNQTTTDTGRVMFEYANNVSPPTSVSNWNGRTWGDSVTWIGGGTWTNGTRYPLDVTTPFTQLYTAGYCDSGEYFTISWRGRNVSTSTQVRRIYGFDIDPTYVAWVVVTHTAASAAIPPRRRRLIQLGSLEPQFIEWTKWECAY